MDKIKHWWKYIFKAVLFTGGSFALGFLIYSNYFRYNKSNSNASVTSGSSIALSREISENQLENIVKKLKNKMVILLANKFDCLHRYFDQEFWGYLKEHEDLVFDKVFDDLYNTQILLSNIEIDQFKKNYCEQIIYKIKERQKFKIHAASHYNNDMLLKYEAALINSYHFSIQEYWNAISLYANSNEKIKKDLEFIKEYKASVYNNELLSIEFDENFKKNYLKILSNIYYINLGKMHQIFKNEFLLKKVNFHNKKEIINQLEKIYEASIKLTRYDYKLSLSNYVIKQFNIKKKEFEFKTILTLYYYYLSPFNPIRVRIDQLNDYYTEIIEGIANGNQFLSLLDGDPESNIKLEEIVDFVSIIKSKIHDKDINFNNIVS